MKIYCTGLAIDKPCLSSLSSLGKGKLLGSQVPLVWELIPEEFIPFIFFHSVTCSDRQLDSMSYPLLAFGHMHKLSIYC